MKLNFCPQCGAQLTMLSQAEYVCAQQHIYWNDVRTTVSVLLFQGETILFSKRGREPNKGMYDLPGGFLDHGETVLGAAVREMKEETGLDFDESDFMVLTSFSGNYFEDEFLCEIIVAAKRWAGTPVAQDDSEALEWKPLDFLQSPEFAPVYTGLSEQLQAILNGDHEISPN